jgi:hypothetical protein
VTLETLDELLETLEELLAVLLDELLDTDADVRHITGPEDELLPEQLSETTPSHPESPNIKNNANKANCFINPSRIVFRYGYLYLLKRIIK